MVERKLNVDIAGSISELQSILKEFRLKQPIYKMFFRGKGLEFEGYRDYYPDDDANLIDWKASMRAQKLLVKKYKEERDLRIMFLIDVGSNMVFGSTEKLKCEFVTELVAAFSRVMLDFNDRIGFILFNEEITHFVECRNGEKQFQIFIDTLSDGSNYGGMTDLDKALDFAYTYLDNSISSVILISDFLNATSETEKQMNILSSRFETVVLRVRDPLDIALPDVKGEIILEDASGKGQLVVDPSIARGYYEKYSLEQGKIVEDIFKKTRVDYLDLTTDKNFAPPLAIFLTERLDKL